MEQKYLTRKGALLSKLHWSMKGKPRLMKAYVGQRGAWYVKKNLKVMAWGEMDIALPDAKTLKEAGGKQFQSNTCT